MAFAAAILALSAVSGWPVSDARATVDAGALIVPVLCANGLVELGAVSAAFPAFGMVRDWVLITDGGPMLSLVVVTEITTALTGPGSGDLTIALEAFGPTYMAMAAERGTNHGLLHRVAVFGVGTLDVLLNSGAVIIRLAVCGRIHRESYLDLVMLAIVGLITALALVIPSDRLVKSFGSAAAGGGPWCSRGA